MPPLPRKPARPAPASEQRFVDAMGLYFARQGVPRIGGRILGLLMLAEGPLGLSDIAARLRVSPASVSTNMRLFLQAGLAELVGGAPGSRRHYYVFSAAGWERRLQAALDGVGQLARICHEGLAGLPAGARAGRGRLLEALDFCNFYAGELSQTAERWRARSAPPTPLPSRRRVAR